MTIFGRVRATVIAVLPFLAGLALGSVIALTAFLGYRVLTDWQDFTEIARGNRDILQAEQAQKEERQAQLDALRDELKAMITQADENNAIRHVSGHPKAPPAATAPIPAGRTTTATTRPRTTTTRPGSPPPPPQTTTTKPQGRPPCTSTPAGCAPEPTTP